MAFATASKYVCRVAFDGRSVAPGDAGATFTGPESFGDAGVLPQDASTATADNAATSGPIFMASTLAHPVPASLRSMRRCRSLPVRQRPPTSVWHRLLGQAALTRYDDPELPAVQASGRAAASACCARQPVQCPGTTRLGAIAVSASTVGPMTGSKAGPLRWRPPTRAADRRDSGEPLRVSHDVDSSGMAAAGEDHQPATAHVDHQCLVVHHVGIVAPLRPGPRLVRRRHASLELRGPVDLTSDQDTAVDQQRRLTPLHEREAFGLQRSPAERRHLQGLGTGNGQSAAGPHHRVDHHGQ